ncbi:MAG: hypothetical protein R6X35_06915 [Candidatus Krumholzibacteriia bacterium]
MHEQRSAAAGNPRLRVAMAATALLVLVVCPVRAQPPGVWEAWKSETYSLAPRESLQLRVGFDDLPVRTWRLVVDGGGHNLDLTVLRVRGEALLHARNGETRHEVDIPWGRGEEIIAVVTSRDHPVAFVVTLLGPPRDQAQAAYSYHVNRALEAYAGGRRIEAEELCRKALAADGRDAEAMVLLAGFRRDRGNYDQAAALVDAALGGDLAPEMRTLAADLRAELLALRAPLPAPLREGVPAAEQDLAKGRPAAALATVEQLLAGGLDLGAPAKSRLQLLRGRALTDLDRGFEALDAFTAALQLCRSRGDEAVIYHHTGRLHLRMGNLQQAQGAYTMALQIGLPSGLDLQAREDLATVEKALAKRR